MSIITIDGSQGEGGGQMLRSSLTLSILTQQPLRMTNVRAKRSKPGLQAQHLASLQAAASICNATVSGDKLGSQSISFHPGPVKAGNYHFKIGTAGATALVLHTVYLPLVLNADGPSEVRIEGGTHALMAPSGEYLTTTWAGYLQALGATIDVKVIRPGFFPKGGGLLEAKTTPSKLTGWNSTMQTAVDRSPELVATLGGKLPEHIAQRMLTRARQRLGESTPGRIELHPHTKSEGVVFSVISHQGPVPTVFYTLGAKGKPAEAVADEALTEYEAFRSSGCPVDPHGADQLLLPLVLAQGSSSYRTSTITQHLVTQRAIIQQFIQREVKIIGNLGEQGDIHVS